MVEDDSDWYRKFQEKHFSSKLFTKESLAYLDEGVHHYIFVRAGNVIGFGTGAGTHSHLWDELYEQGLIQGAPSDAGKIDYGRFTSPDVLEVRLRGHSYSLGIGDDKQERRVIVDLIKQALQGTKIGIAE